MGTPTATRLAVVALVMWSTWCASDDDLLPAQRKDLVVGLPGQPEVEFRHFAGYVTVNASSGTALFYWFFEASKKPLEKPLLLWLTGGPGCSSIGAGAVQEIGPFLVEKGPTLRRNMYSWNLVANLLFLESPAGVGFSYSNTSDVRDEDITALQAHAFLVGWLDRFPQYRTSDFYMAGESYAGHFIPQLAKVILEVNAQAPESSAYIKLKGILLGNPSLHEVSDIKGMIESAWHHGFLSDRFYAPNCNFSAPTADCEAAKAEFATFLDKRLININNLYSRRCEADNTLLNSSMPSRTMAILHYGLLLHGGPDPCLKRYATEYFNHLDVQESLHANVTNIPRPWTLCRDQIWQGEWKWQLSVLPTIPSLILSGVRVWVYSGDVDGRIPVSSTRYSLAELAKYGVKIKQHLSPWYDHNEVGGWMTVYDGLTFLTVRGAGHLVPLDSPNLAFQIAQTFLMDGEMKTSPF